MWAGWGHASENPKLPELLHKNGIAFMGMKSLIAPSVPVFSFQMIYMHLFVTDYFPRTPQSGHVGSGGQNRLLHCGSDRRHSNPAVERHRLDRSALLLKSWVLRCDTCVSNVWHLSLCQVSLWSGRRTTRRRKPSTSPTTCMSSAASRMLRMDSK